MRALPTLIFSLGFIAGTAQVDINKMMQERMQRRQAEGQGSGTAPGDGSGHGVKMEDDNDPFVPNEFIGSFRMEMHHYDGTVEQKNSPMNTRYWSKEDMTLNATEMPERKGRQMKMLTDLKGKWSYMLMTDEKGKRTAMKSRKRKVVMEEASTTAKKEPVITVTKETRVIEGHTCTKVIVVTEDGTWTGWVAKDVKAPFTDMMRSVQQRGNDNHMHAVQGVDGMPLEFEWLPADGKSRMVCYIKELESGKVDPAVFSLDGYEVVEMPSVGR
ncbi:MAG: DUF4412 domain-containing protein [Flavobacteriales bacterium]|nr:DUF4412 domain-containing protein [Flavobacteriales bacterium]